MRPNITLIDGDWWPAGDEQCRKAVMDQYTDVDRAIALCTGKDVAVQAGGNCGIWPRYLAGHFKTVYTFEPDADNFYCLTLNAPQPNIIKMQAVLGTKGQPISMNLQPDNIGAHRVGDSGGIPQIRIDDLRLRACDLIQLDVEGFEYYALMGARVTIERRRPIIMLEDKGHHIRYGIHPEAINELLNDMGYRLFQKIHRDIIMVPKEMKL